MPQRRAGVKDLRKNRARHMHNLDIKSDLKKTTKKFLTAVNTKNDSETKSLLNVLYKKLDKASKRNILHKNTAAHRKSKFTKLLAKS